jgi:hypothetical protein
MSDQITLSAIGEGYPNNMAVDESSITEHSGIRESMSDIPRVKAYTGRWIGLLQLVMINVIVSWTVS